MFATVHQIKTARHANSSYEGTLRDGVNVYLFLAPEKKKPRTWQGRGCRRHARGASGAA
ncbi:hypothetical protein FHX57_000341 [Paraburkholderia tropica]|uniref:Uncharacterized protein n=1 Tax=Paraburkholderia tropica TaxID=92647 RepID=A0AAQ1JS95_9BURK|nr:hypothetical protein [Paraburkholderia tropica]MBB2998028.1 hypothetical protein [Paraburkholderia tropica]MBB6317050.1 hypothetical protein [Paraburkholderia tropica]PXX20500.1 hypothetical protein C7400_101227 [Paraburkholderia tropica]PZW89578.1 hypothetical protein C7399_101227 [Paraburkholderia tropica]